MSDATEELSMVTPAFKRAMRRLAATVTVISTADADGRRHGMTATSVTSLSMDPPSILICVNHNASVYSPLFGSRKFCVNILTIGQEGLVTAFGGKLAGEDRFGVGTWLTGDAGLPFLEAAQSNLFCSVDQVVPYGSHSIFIGRVNAVRVEDEVRPLLFSDGQLCALAERVPPLHS